MNVLTAIAVISVFSVEVKGACKLASRIKRNDSEVTVSQYDQPCKLTLTARSNKQVVVVMYGMKADCAWENVTTLAIYDGSLVTKDNLITSNCQAQPWSFASRLHSLTLAIKESQTVPRKQLRSFYLDIHAIYTLQTFLTPTGTIQSQRYKGGISGSETGEITKTTPNNFHGVYQIIAKVNVTMELSFLEFRTKPCNNKWGDYILIRYNTDISRAICNEDEEKLQPLSVSTRNLTIEFLTDKEDTLTGFTAAYNVCVAETDDASGEIAFIPFLHSESMTCAYIINVQENTRIKYSLTFHGGGSCSDILKVSLDGNIETPGGCTTSYEYSEFLDTSHTAILHFSFNKSQSVTGFFSNENVVTPIIVSLLVVLVIIVIVVVIILRRRLKNKDNELAARYKPGMDDIEVYDDNEDYDQLHRSREHKMTSSENHGNIYGASPTPKDEYAVVVKTKRVEDLQPTEEYDDQNLGTEYDETEKAEPTNNIKIENVYE